MEREKALAMVLGSYSRYYNVITEGVRPPFCAEAVFQAHSEKYLLIKAAKIAEEDSNEFVFFATESVLTPDRLDLLIDTAWEKGIGRVVPASGHRNSDVTLMILADKCDGESLELARKAKRYKSYRFSFWGWSNFNLAVLDLEHDRIVTNRRGSDLKKLFPQFIG